MRDYVQYFHDLIAAINDLPGKLLRVVASIHEPIDSLRNTLVVTNILLSLLVVTSIANAYLLWKNARK